MRKHLMLLSLAAVTLVPSLAFAQQTCEERRNNRVAGTVVGAGIGAIIGSAVAGRGDRNEGAVIGAIGGGVIGNQATKGDGDCREAYGYYDNGGSWHSNPVARDQARGYYDRNGNWVVGQPSGRWDNDRWVAPNAQGYGYNASYGGNDYPRDVRGRLSWLDERVQRGQRDGSLSRREATRAMRDLDQVRADERRMRGRNGRLRASDESYLQSRLDTITSEIRWSRQN